MRTKERALKTQHLNLTDAASSALGEYPTAMFYTDSQGQVFESREGDGEAADFAGVGLGDVGGDDEVFSRRMERAEDLEVFRVEAVGAPLARDGIDGARPPGSTKSISCRSLSRQCQRRENRPLQRRSETHGEGACGLALDCAAIKPAIMGVT